MSQVPDSGESHSGEISTPSSFANLPPSVTGPDTVVNPERHGMFAASGSTPAMSGSSIYGRLFPPSVAAVDMAPFESAAGLRLGHFVIEERIGMGGMGAVFRAVDLGLNRVVALKVLAPALSTDQSTLQRFQNEARAAAHFNHDNIARVFYIGEDQGLHFIAYELVNGTNLRDMIRQNGRLKVADAVNYTLQIAAALKHTSAASFVHRDIKPSNIIITPTGRAKLVDLGLARMNRSEPENELTSAGTTMGTFDYISPEQAKDPRKVDVRSDIYSLGCTLYHVLTGGPPYPEGTVLQKLLDHQGKDPPDPAEINPHVSPRLSAVVQRMMASDLRQRYASPDDLIRDLVPVAGELGLRGTNPEGLVWKAPTYQKPPFWRRHLAWMLSAAALLLIVLISDWIVPLTRNSENANFAGTDWAATTQPHNQRDERRPVVGTRDGIASTESESVGAAASEPGSLNGTGMNEPVDPTDIFGASDDSAAPADTIIGSHAALSESNNPGNGSTSPSQLSSSPPPVKLLDSIDLLTNLGPSGLPAMEMPDRPTGTFPLAAGDRNGASPIEAPHPGTAPESLVAGRSESDPSGSPATTPGALPAISILAPDGAAQQAASYPTLEAAIADAENGDVIELNYDGRRPAPPEKKPLVVTKELTIRAGKNPKGKLYHPVIELDADTNSADEEIRPITLIGGQLELINVEISFSIPENAGRNHSALFSLHGSAVVRLHGVTLSVLNPGGRSATVFDLISGPSTGGGTTNSANETPVGARSEFEIEILETLVRGQCDLFLVRHTHPGRFDIKDSVISVDGTVLSATGDLDEPAENVHIDLHLEHVTCLTGSGLLKMDSGDEMRELLPVYVTARNNIFATNTTGPLIEMLGNTNMRDFRQLLNWSGMKNSYENFPIFWTIAPSQVTIDVDELDYDGWTHYWGANAEVDSSPTGIVWKRPWQKQKTLSEITPADLELDHTSNNFSTLQANDGSDIGADLSKFLSRP